MKKSAFTLIELLVVIAIIAILAAILFPVFAQAKAAAKKTQALSNVKNLTTANLIYNTDYDDTYMIATPFVPGIGYAWDRFIPTTSLIKTTTPAGVASGINTAFHNSIQPYMKNYQILRDPAGSSRSPLPASVFTAAGITAADISAANPPVINYTYNGLLDSYQDTAIANVAETITWWPGQGARGFTGAGYGSPQLICLDQTTPCRYIPATSAACSGNGGFSFYTSNTSGFGWDLYSRSLVYAYADGHAKTHKIGIYGTGQTDPRVDPFAFYLGKEVDRFRAGGARYWEQFYCHPYLFRPDIDHSNWDTVLIAP
ncbi:MAG: prepilin-type N-terminal cleavage/methylation domain-containing protein [Fimbriimonadaceae bacterium]